MSEGFAVAEQGVSESPPNRRPARRWLRLLLFASAVLIVVVVSSTLWARGSQRKATDICSGVGISGPHSTTARGALDAYLDEPESMGVQPIDHSAWHVSTRHGNEPGVITFEAPVPGASGTSVVDVVRGGGTDWFAGSYSGCP